VDLAEQSAGRTASGAPLGRTVTNTIDVVAELDSSEEKRCQRS
jgi:hypothetical protein